MGGGDRGRAVDFAPYVGGSIQQHPPACLAGNISRWLRDGAARDFSNSPTETAVDAVRGRSWPDAHVGVADPPERRPDRDSLSRIRVARLPGILSRLASADSRNGRGCRRSCVSRNLLSAIGLRYSYGQSMAVGGAC